MGTDGLTMSPRNDRRANIIDPFAFEIAASHLAEQR